MRTWTNLNDLSMRKARDCLARVNVRFGSELRSAPTPRAKIERTTRADCGGRVAARPAASGVGGALSAPEAHALMARASAASLDGGGTGLERCGGRQKSRYRSMAPNGGLGNASRSNRYLYQFG
jgi:hypothetical protein